MLRSIRLRCVALEDRAVPAIVPVGPEFKVDVGATLAVGHTAVALDADGDSLIAWHADNTDGSSLAVMARRYSSTGAAITAPFQVNTFTVGAQQNPVAASDSAGNVVVAWGSASAQDGSREGVYFRRFSPTGAALTGEVLANQFTLNIQALPAIAMDPMGDFVVAWESNYQDGDGYGIFARRFNAAGVALGNEFAVNLATVGDQRRPVVGMDNAGNFVIAWEGVDASLEGVFARRFSAAGVALGGEFAVNATTTAEQLHPSVAVDNDGDFTIAWQSQDQDGSGLGVYARRYTANGTGLGGEFRVNAFTTGDQGAPAIAADANGEVDFTWESLGQDGAGWGIYGRRMDAGGGWIANEFRVHSTVPGNQRAPALAAAAIGSFTVAWVSDNPSKFGVIAQRHARPPVPTATLQVDDGTPQRSAVRSLTLTFNTLVTIGVNGVVLTGPAGTVTLTPDFSLSTTPQTIVKYTVSGNGVTPAGLIDGNYTLTIKTNLVANFNPEAYDGNGDGAPGPDGVFLFHRFYGDFDGDRDVDVADLAAFRFTFGLNSSAAGFLSCFDSDGDGDVDTADLVAFRPHYGTMLPP